MSDDVHALPAAAEPTHYMRRVWRVHNYTFYEALPKPEPSLGPAIYFVAWRGEWVSRESFNTIENAMQAAASFGMTKHALAS